MVSVAGHVAMAAQKTNGARRRGNTRDLGRKPAVASTEVANKPGRRHSVLLEYLEQQKKLTIDQWEIFAAVTIGDMLDFFDWDAVRIVYHCFDHLRRGALLPSETTPAKAGLVGVRAVSKEILS